MSFHQKLVVYYILDYFGILFIRDTCEMPSSAPVRPGGFFTWYSGFRPPLINDRLDITAMFLKGP